MCYIYGKEVEFNNLSLKYIAIFVGKQNTTTRNSGEMNVLKLKD